MAQQFSIWTTVDEARWFLLPDDAALAEGALHIRNLDGRTTQVDHASLAPYEITEDQARRWAKERLGQTLNELREAIDERLGELRQRLDDFNRRPVSDETSLTPNAVPAILELLRQFPRVFVESLSTDESRVDAARRTMADLQGRLRAVGIDVDDRFKDFPARLAVLRHGKEE